MLGSSLPPVVCRRVMFYLRYLCFFAHSGVQRILCFDFVSFLFVLCNLCCQFLWIFHLLLPLRNSLTCICSLWSTIFLDREHHAFVVNNIMSVFEEDFTDNMCPIPLIQYGCVQWLSISFFNKSNYSF